MSNMKVYVGSGKEKKFDNGGSLISVTLSLDDLLREYNNHGFMSNRGDRKIKITVGTRRSVGEYGDTHTVTMDTWHPSDYMKPHKISIISDAITEGPGPDDDIPF